MRRALLVTAGACLVGVHAATLKAGTESAVRAQDPAAAAADSAASQDGLGLALLRTWDAGAEVTVVDGLAAVPLDALAAGVDGERAYSFEVQVEDSRGTVLYRDSWERQVSRRAADVQARVQGAALQETFRFGVKPGTYRVTLTARPVDAPGTVVRESRSLEAYGSPPPASDLILAGRIEPLDEAAGGTGWPITRSGFGIGASAATVVLPGDPELYYYLEIYAAGSESATAEVNAEIHGADGGVVYRTPARSVEVVPPGVPFTGRLSVAGLPPGEYALVMNVRRADGAAGASRRAPFRVSEDAPAGLAAAPPAQPAVGEYFASLSDEELESTFGGVAVMISETARRAYEDLPPDAKRRYLTEFFRRHDPDPMTPGNAFLDEYLERIEFLRTEFSYAIGTTERDPWRTDPGRIYLRLGPPSDRLVRPRGGRMSYEIWSYGGATHLVYLFVDETGMTAPKLFFTTDPNEQSLVDWERRMARQSPDALAAVARDLRRFGVYVELQND